MFYFETFQIILNLSSVKKIKQHLAMSAIQNHRLCDARKDNAVMQKTSNANPRQPATSKSLKANAGPKVMQRILNRSSVVFFLIQQFACCAVSLWLFFKEYNLMVLNLGFASP